ncbi:HAD-IA family hydrolase [Streptomyces sp. WZ-12]|uniref:HAD-IA family hydrolase n=1 Tax=Streptomyces sp. WZ-12 TaxID=3030210 RepID=UPI002380DDDC|nr:HAD-IA family hydrolase [Streptomyces sp. WZ-12]
MTPAAATATVLRPTTVGRDYAAVLFDLDGTLVESGDSVDRAWNLWCARYDVVPEELEGLLHGHTAVDLIRTVRPYWPADKVAQAARYQLQIQEEDPTPGTAMPGAAELLASLTARGQRWAVVTACSAALARHRLAASGLPVPEVLVTADDCPRGKPDPAPYLLGAEALGVSPTDCLVVEDAPSGIRSGRAAGCTVVAITTTHQAAALVEAGAVLPGLAHLEFAHDTVASTGRD